jgi:hypothetical protein
MRYKITQERISGGEITELVTKQVRVMITCALESTNKKATLHRFGSKRLFSHEINAVITSKTDFKLGDVIQHRYLIESKILRGHVRSNVDLIYIKTEGTEDGAEFNEMIKEFLELLTIDDIDVDKKSEHNIVYTIRLYESDTKLLRVVINSSNFKYSVQDFFKDIFNRWYVP